MSGSLKARLHSLDAPIERTAITDTSTLAGEVEVKYLVESTFSIGESALKVVLSYSFAVSSKDGLFEDIEILHVDVETRWTIERDDVPLDDDEIRVAPQQMLANITMYASALANGWVSRVAKRVPLLSSHVLSIIPPETFLTEDFLDRFRTSEAE